VSFFSLTRVIQDLTTKRIVAVAPKHGGLYKLDPLAIGKVQGKGGLPSKPTHIVVYNNKPSLHSNSSLSATHKIASSVSIFDTLHARLGHTSLSKIKHIAECKSHISDPFFCEICVLATPYKLPFNKSSISTHSPFELLHMDLWGPVWFYILQNLEPSHLILSSKIMLI